MKKINTVKEEKKNVRILAEGYVVSNDTRKTQLNCNDLLIGSSGSGKTGSYVLNQLLTAEDSIVIADTKCNLYNNHRDFLKAKGYTVHKLDLTAPQNSTFAYNPLQYIPCKMVNGRMVYDEQSILSIADVLCPVTTAREPFWENAAQQVLCCLIAYVLEEFGESEKNLASVADLYKVIAASVATNDGRRDGIDFLEAHSILHPDSFASRKYKAFKGVFDADRTWACIAMYVSNSLHIFDFGAAREMLTKHTAFRLEELGRRKTALFINISDTDRSMDKIANIFYTQLLQTLCREADSRDTSCLKVPVRVILDDFATNAYIPDFDKIISVVRSRNIYLSIILQSLTQLETLYTAPQAATIINNCDHWLYLGGFDSNTIRLIAERCCKLPEDIMSMPLDSMYICERGSKGRLVKKITPYSMLPQLDAPKVRKAHRTKCYVHYSEKQ